MSESYIDLRPVLEALHEGNTIKAIKIYREITGYGLREAREAVESMRMGGIYETRQMVDSANEEAALTEGPAMQEIRQLIASGNKIGAIKQYRQMTGLGLKQAKDAVELLEQGYTLPQPVSQQTSYTYELQEERERVNIDEVQRLLASKRKIEAIKYVRECTGVGLKEAKDAVDALEKGHIAPILQSQILQNQASAEVPQNPTGLVDPDELQRLIRADRRIEAIKYFRECTGVSLKEAKDAVDWLASSMGK